MEKKQYLLIICSSHEYWDDQFMILLIMVLPDHGLFDVDENGADQKNLAGHVALGLVVIGKTMEDSRDLLCFNF